MDLRWGVKLGTRPEVMGLSEAKWSEENVKLFYASPKYNIGDVAATLFDRLMHQRIGLMLAFVIFLPVHKCQTE
jgi:hypothetical protein